MGESQKIERCDKCGGPPGQELITVNNEPRWRVVCILCGHMTPHMPNLALALTIWNERTGQRADTMENHGP